MIDWEKEVEVGAEAVRTRRGRASGLLGSSQLNFILWCLICRKSLEVQVQVL